MGTAANVLGAREGAGGSGSSEWHAPALAKGRQHGVRGIQAARDRQGERCEVEHRKKDTSA